MKSVYSFRPPLKKSYSISRTATHRRAEGQKSWGRKLPDGFVIKDEKARHHKRGNFPVLLISAAAREDQGKSVFLSLLALFL